MLCGSGWVPGVIAQDSLPLPPPDHQGGKPLMQALHERRTVRDFRPSPLTPQQLSDLLWAAFGINRPATGHRTAPSAKNAQETDLYVALPEGLFRYDAARHGLVRLSSADVRGATSGQDFAQTAPLTLLYVADLSRFKDTREPDARRYAIFDAGCISQNVSLYCASAGLGTVVHELDREPLAARLELRPDQLIVMAQTVGHLR